MAALIDGPRLAAKSRTTKQLVVFLHGYGADGNDLIGLAKQWQGFMPDAAFVSPNAPEPCVQAPGGRQWFALTMRDENERWAGVNKAAPGLNAFLDAELDKLQLDDSKLALVGFSQGTMLALHVGLRRGRPPAALLGYSGELVGREHLAEAHGPGAKTSPILLVHGSDDDVIPLEIPVRLRGGSGRGRDPLPMAPLARARTWHRRGGPDAWRPVSGAKL